MQNIFQLPRWNSASYPLLALQMAKQPLPDPPRSCTNQFEQSRLQFILDAWKPKLHQSLGHFDLSRPNKPQNLDQKQKTGGNWREKRKARIICHFYSCVEKKTFHYFHGSLFMFSRIFAPVRASLLRFSDSIVLPVVDTPPTGSASARFSKHCGWSPLLPAFKK